MASIDLRFTQDPFEPQVQSYDLRVEVLDADGLPPEIFVFNQGVAPVFTTDATPGDMFVSVADPLDLEAYPAGSPSGPDIPYYRLAEVTLRFRSQQLLLQTKQFIIDDVQGLLNAINGALADPVTEDITIS